eukprot:1931763-Alexandrium_andersonii.AAC.1
MRAVAVSTSELSRSRTPRSVNLDVQYNQALALYMPSHAAFKRRGVGGSADRSHDSSKAPRCAG